MVQVIENKEDAGAEECIEFPVYRSKVNPDLVLGGWQHAESVPNGQRGIIAVASEKLGTPVDLEFQRVITYAHQHGIPFVWVNDPDGLFPASDRPEFQVV
jgi:hypothetical protein